jgi:hypothetical protein
METSSPKRRPCTTRQRPDDIQVAGLTMSQWRRLLFITAKDPELWDIHDALSHQGLYQQDQAG